MGGKLFFKACHESDEPQQAQMYMTEPVCNYVQDNDDLGHIL